MWRTNRVLRCHKTNAYGAGPPLPYRSRRYALSLTLAALRRRRELTAVRIRAGTYTPFHEVRLIRSSYAAGAAEVSNSWMASRRAVDASWLSSFTDLRRSGLASLDVRGLRGIFATRPQGVRGQRTVLVRPPFGWSLGFLTIPRTAGARPRRRRRPATARECSWRPNAQATPEWATSEVPSKIRNVPEGRATTTQLSQRSVTSKIPTAPAAVAACHGEWVPPTQIRLTSVKSGELRSGVRHPCVASRAASARVLCGETAVP